MNNAEKIRMINEDPELRRMYQELLALHEKRTAKRTLSDKKNDQKRNQRKTARKSRKNNR